MLEVNEFNAIRISLASPDQIRSWSSGEVTKPETINYRTLRPEKDGLFDERIFGPTRDWECYCGKYKRIRYKGIICDKCGVEVTRAKVRRERMGHIQLASPVSHIWFFKGTPSRLGILLDMSPRNLERILYFALYLITHIDEHQRERVLQQIEEEAEGKIRRLEQTISDRTGAVESRASAEIMRIRTSTEQRVRQQEEQLASDSDALTTAASKVKEQLEDNVGKPASKDIVFKQAELTNADKGDNLTKSMLTQLQRSLQKQLDAMVKTGRKEEEQTRADSEKKIADIRMRADQDLSVVRQDIAPDVQIVRDESKSKREEVMSIKALEPKTEAEYRALADKYRFFRAQMGAEAVLEIMRQIDLPKLSLELQAEMRSTTGQRRKKSIKRLRLVKALLRSGASPEWMILTILAVIPPDLRPMVQLDGGRFATSDLNDLYRRVINRNNRLKRLLELGAPEIIVNNEKRTLQDAVDALFDNGRRGRPVTGPGNRPLKSLSDMLKGKQGRFRQNLLGKRVDYSGRSVIVSGPSLRLHQCGLPKLMALELFKPFIMARLVERKSAQNIKAAKKMVDSMIPEVWDVLEEVIHEHPVLLNRAPTLHRLGIQAFEPVLVEGKAIQVHPLVCHAFNADFDGDQMAVHVPLSAEAQAEARLLMLSANNILSPASGRALATPTQDMVLGSYYLTYSDKNFDELDVEKMKPRPPRFRTEEEVEFAIDAKQLTLQQPIEYLWEGELVLTTSGRVIFNAEVDRALREAVGEINEEYTTYHDFINRTLSKKELSDFISTLVDEYGAHTVASVLDTIKELGFHYATKAGVTISKNDIVIPPEKEKILADYEQRVAKVEQAYEHGLITESERHESIVNIWTEATDAVADAMERNLNELNPIYMMANSGARGSFTQLRQLAGMRGLMANPKGEIIERPIKANFMEGLSVLEYFISTHGARKGQADTALRTADSGYLTRRLVDVSQDVIIREADCKTKEFVELPLFLDDGLNKSVAARILAEDVFKPLASGKPGKTQIAEKGEEITMPRLRDIVEELGDAAEDFVLPVRSVAKCKAETGVCQSCYGTFLATGEMSEIGDAVGIIAAPSIGEPGTQLTMRTFHTARVAGADITHGLPRVVEIFEARNPKGAAVLAEVGGAVAIEQTDRGPKITVTPNEVGPNGELGDPVEYQLPRRTRLLVTNGEVLTPGDPLNEGSQNPADKLALKGSTSTELYLVGEVQKVYKSQGVEIHDKHIELIVRQMLKKVRVESNGDTDLLPGQLVDKAILERENGKVKAKGEKATFEPLILGITKASLATESFLSAASFQETTKVLTDAAIEGKIDRLLGLKENVIIGKLIPAATGLKRYRNIDIAPSEPIVREAYERDSLLQALEEIGQDGGSAIDFGGLDVTFGGEPGSDRPTTHEAGEAEEVPEVDSPLDD